MKSHKARSTAELLDIALSRKEGNLAYLELALVAPTVADRIERITNYKVHGFVHSLDEAAVRHIFNQHGDVKTEEKRGQLAINSLDFEMLSTVLNEPDEIFIGNRDQTVQICKRLGDELVVVQEVRTGRKKLAVITMWKKPLSAPVAPSTELTSTAEASISQTDPVRKAGI